MSDDFSADQCPICGGLNDDPWQLCVDCIALAPLPPMLENVCEWCDQETCEC